MPPSRADYAKIHIARKELGLTDENYRDMLRVHFGVESSKNLAPRQVSVLLNKFRAKGWQPRQARVVKDGREGTVRKDDNYIKIESGPAAKQQRYALALWNALGYDVAKLHARCKKQFGVDRFEWVTEYSDLHILITDLQQRCHQAGIDPEP